MERRDFVKAIVAGSLVSTLPNFAFAQTNNRQPIFIWISLKGALDGLNTVVPRNNPDYVKMRPNIAISDAHLLQLNKQFGLHPSLKWMHQKFQAKQAIIYPAVSTGYPKRSHFDAQKVLENGTQNPFHESGWLNRFLHMEQNSNALAIDSGMPLLMRGEAEVSSWYPSKLQLKSRQEQLIASMYQDQPQLQAYFEKAVQLESLVDMSGAIKRNFSDLCRYGAEFLTSKNGPNVMSLELGGWDTHSAQGNHKGKLANGLATLDKGLEILEQGLKERWQDTMIIAMSEFGRTVSENGSKGTDHGHATPMFILGGGVSVGKLASPWSSLKASALYEGRDLAATARMDTILIQQLSRHFSLPKERVEPVFSV